MSDETNESTGSAEGHGGSRSGRGGGGRSRAAINETTELGEDYETIKRDLAELREDMSALMSHMRSGANSAVERVSERASAQLDERPLTSLAVAFVAGFIASRMLR